MNRRLAELFAAQMFDLIICAGAEQSTAHKCAAVWWQAIEDGHFGAALQPEEQP